MYPQVNKEQMPSAPPPYSESVINDTHHVGNSQQADYKIYSQYPPPPFQQNVPSQVIVVQAPPLPPLGSKSVQLTCPSCKAVVGTSVEEASSTNAHLCCLFLCIVGLGLCSCIPYFMENFKTYKHTCPRCNAFIGTYKPS